MRITPAHIDTLKPNEIFVFGSNNSGKHHHGAAAKALEFGAIMGQSEGLQGQAYAINTKSGSEVIASGVKTLIDFAITHPELIFLVTPVGCGLAHHSPDEIAPLFAEALNVENIYLPQLFLNILKEAVS